MIKSIIIKINKPQLKRIYPIFIISFIYIIHKYNKYSNIYNSKFSIIILKIKYIIIILENLINLMK